ncbi:MAG TPA: class I SAM-dependent methyltransferase [Candidatus Sulfotelmatobacter sp.]
MDATVYRSAETQGRKPVNHGATVEPKFKTVCRQAISLANGSRSLSVSEGYEHWAPIYDQEPNPLLAREERYLLPLLRELPNKRLLDLACGTGRWLARLTALGCESGVGIDCSSGMLRVAGAKHEITGRLARASCDRLPFRAAAFDLAICSFALGHVHHLAPVVCELARVTKPGAAVFVSDLHHEAYTRGWRVGFRDEGAAVQIETLPHPAEEIVQTFASNGFECRTQLSLFLGDAEQPIFARAGKSHSFAAACQLPAVLVCRFKRFDSMVDAPSA